MSTAYTQSYGYNAIGNITNTSRLGNYVYTATVASCVSGTPSIKPHAVSRAGSNLYTYDCNGNMLTRVEVTGTQRITYTQQWNAENHLTVVTNTAVVPNLVSRFVYDGDGSRVLQIQISGTEVITTAYAGAIEVQITATQRITKTYYSAGAQLIAMRVYTSPTSSVLYFLHSDHLGSTSLTTDASGNVVARQLYDAWGNVRVKGDLKTDITFTGQRSNLDQIGLYYFKARFYASSLGRFVSADTLVPDGKNPQQYNRYAYGLNNPVKYTDPTGHDPWWCESTQCERKYLHRGPAKYAPEQNDFYSETYGYLDQSHMRAGIAGSIIGQVGAKAKEGGNIFVTDLGFSKGPLWGNLSANYEISPYNSNRDGSLEDYITGVSLGIYEDYQTRFEAFEGTRASGASMLLTGFGIEDLPSDYVGFVMAAKGLSRDEVFDMLGGVVPVSGPPRPAPMNVSFNPLVNGKLVSWPEAVNISPISAETGAWKYLSQSSNQSLAVDVVQSLTYGGLSGFGELMRWTLQPK